MTNVQASDYLKKPYTRVLIPDEESGTLTARIVEFPGCIAQGDNPAEAYERLEAAAEAWIEAALEMRQQIPEPASNAQYGGRFALRLPRSLHCAAAQLAELEGVSLNQLIVATLAEKVGGANLYYGYIQKFTTLFRSIVTTARTQVVTVDSNRYLKIAATNSSSAPLLQHVIGGH